MLSINNLIIGLGVPYNFFLVLFFCSSSRGWHLISGLHLTAVFLSSCSHFLNGLLIKNKKNLSYQLVIRYFNFLFYFYFLKYRKIEKSRVVPTLELTGRDTSSWRKQDTQAHMKGLRTDRIDS